MTESTTLPRPPTQGDGQARAASLPPAREQGVARTVGWRAIAREPLLHFVVIAGLVFGLDRLLHPPSQSERVITVTRQMRQELIDRFDEDKAVKPTPQQLQQLVDFWVATEILYREGRSMGLERGDDMVRSRIAHKLQLLIFSDIDVGDPSEEQLAEWFAKNHARFDTPQKLDFYLASAASEQEARDAVAKIGAGTEPESLQEQTRVFQGRPASSVAEVFGTAFLTQLLALPRNVWTAAQSKEGWHVVRVDGVTEAAASTLAAARQTAVQEWKTEETRKRALAAVDRLKTSYTIIDEGAR